MLVILLCITVLTGVGRNSFAQDTKIIFGKAVSLQKVVSKTSEKDKPLVWINVNTEPAYMVFKERLTCLFRTTDRSDAIRKAI